jgi:mannosyltransferase
MSSRDDSETMASRGALVAAICISLVALLLRLWQARESLWLDELHTAWCATGDLHEVASRAMMGNQSPLFFWLEWMLGRALGPSELALRLPSILAGALLPLVLYCLASRFLSWPVGLVAAALVSIDASFLFYGTEARPYALVHLLAVIHIWLTAEQLRRSNAIVRVAWVAVGAVLIHVHYTAALLIPAEIAFVAVAKSRCSLRLTGRIPATLLDLSILAALCLPAMANVLAIYGRRVNWNSFITQQPPWRIFDWWWYAWALPLIAASLGARFLLRRTNDETDSSCNGRSWFLALVVCWLLVPASIAWMTTQLDIARIFFPRYLVVCAPAAVLLMAAVIDFAPRIWFKAFIALTLIGIAIWLGGVIDQARHSGRLIGDRTENWRDAIAWLNEQLPVRHYPVLVASGLIEADALREEHPLLLDDYCLAPVTSLYPLAAHRADLIPLPYRDPGRLESAARNTVVNRRGVWLVVRGSKEIGLAVAHRMISQIESDASDNTPSSVIRAHESFGTVQIVLIAAKETPE